MTEPTDQLQITLRSNNLSATKPREIVFRALLGNEPQSMQQLVNRCKDDINRASVYRTVALYERLGIIQRLQIGWKYKLELTDSFMHHHHHLSCSRCNAVIPITEDVGIERRILALAKAQGFAPQDHQLEIRGLCADCQAII
jgi:Fur family ferric uptake transcriptional regulator